MSTIEDSIHSALVIYCDYCKKPEICHRVWDSEFERNELRRSFVVQLESLGWTINASNAVKCGQCNWQEKYPQ